MFFLAILTVAILYFLFFKSESAIVPSEENIIANFSKNTESRQVRDGWREYKSVAYRFSLLYPENLEINEHKEGGNAITITFQDAKKGEGFQIFILPYGENQVSGERFKQDIPTGVRKDMSDIIIDGATGAAFYSRDAILGETREIWFIRSGLLYEVTTLAELDTWLSEIMKTWRFERA